MFTTTDIKTKINQLRHHYNNNLNNKYLKAIIIKLEIPHLIHRDLDYLLLSEIVYLDSKGAINDLYAGIKAVIYFIKNVEIKITPHIHSYTELGKNHYSGNESILYQMAIKNFAKNMEAFTKILEELFIMTVDYDSSSFSNNEVYNTFQGFKELQEFFELQQQKISK